MKKTNKPEKAKLWVPFVAAGVFALLACLNLTTAIWYDEAYSAYLVRGDFVQIWNMTSIDVHPPFYYFCLKVWSLIFGTSDVALRSMSVFFAAIGIILAYFLLKRWFGAKAAAWGTFGLSLAPLLMRYSQEMRMYGVVFAIVMGATLVLDIALKTKSKKAWLGYALLICLGMWTHYFTALAWLAHFAYIIYYFVKNGLQKAVFWAYPLAVGLFLPWIPFFLKQSDSVQQGFWIPPVSFTTPMSFVTESLIFHDAAATTNWLVILVIAAVVAVTYLLVKSWRKMEKTERENSGFLATVILLPPLILMLLSMEPFQPTYMTRYVTYAASLLWVVIGLAIYWAKRNGLKTAAIVTAALVLACAAVGITTVDMREEPGDKDARAVMAVITKDAAPVLVHVDSMHYYDLLFYETEQNPTYAIDVNFEWGSLEPMREYKMNHLEDVDGFVAQHDNFWIILEPEIDEKTGDRIVKPYEFDGYTTDVQIDNATFAAFYYTKEK